VYGVSVIEFRIDSRSGVAPYHQIVQQVRQALRLGMLQVGDQLPTVKEVAAQVAIRWPATSGCGPDCSAGWARRAPPVSTTTPSPRCSRAHFVPLGARTWRDRPRR
jgi:Bacterial regulatory proteins, gntR family